jgi:peptidoglycan-N-acetylglucosamine deacetylase
MKHRINILVFALSLTLICLFLWESNYFVLLLVLSFLIFFITLSIGVLFLKANYFLTSKTRLNGKVALLTFDDGPDPINTPKVLDTLSKHQTKAIFFLIGEKAEQNSDVVKRIISEGHVIGNHSYEHNNFMTLFSKNRLRKELKKSQEVLTKISASNIDLFRPPIGYTNPKYAVILKELKLKCIGWTLRSYDSVYKTPDQLNKRLVTNIRPGHIVLLHDNLDVTADALDDFMTRATGNGIIFASSENINTVLND